ncbi:hypothetical protein B0H13DRAFT_1896652 [Mycena leptocephala]|nr:hypothetical protein B0H13DRAFT_1896652 [Mycena leptocephala]
MDLSSQKNIGVNASPVVEAKRQKDCRIDTRTSGNIAEVEIWLGTNEVWATNLKAVHETKESKKYGRMDKKTNTGRRWNQESKIHRQIDAGKKPVEERKSCEAMEQESKIHRQINAGTKPVEERKICKAMEPRAQEINGQIDAETKPVEEWKSCEAMEPREQDPRTGRRGNKNGGGTEKL